MKHLTAGLALLASLTLSNIAQAHENGQMGPHALDHAPIGVMADHRHKKGEWMLSIRHMHMQMDGSRDGTNQLTSDLIATTAPNRFAGLPGQPPTLRVVPTEMSMDMTMFGAMYGLTDDITLMGMTSYVSNEMSHLTYRGGMGTNIRGTFETKSQGIGDTTIGAIIGLDNGSKEGHQFNASLAISLPTGSISRTDEILTPMGGTPSPQLPYAMQIGTGTVDFKPSLTWFDRAGKIGWGAQTSARIPLEQNSENYRHGDQIKGTAWLAYEPTYWLSFSTRVKAVSKGRIRGQSAAIIAPVQTADPNNYGGETVEALFGANLVGQTGTLKGHRLAFEIGLPLHRNLNGPQLETDSMFIIGWQKAF